MRVLITGVNGFSGSNLAEFFLRKGHEVVGLGRNGFTNSRRINEGKHEGQWKFIDIDLCSAQRFLPGNMFFDAVIHTAAHSPHPEFDPYWLFHNNVVSTLSIVEVVKRLQPKILIFFSTMSVYGSITKKLVTEDTPHICPDIYGVSKRVGEELISGISPTATLSIRLPAVIGNGCSRHWLSNVYETLNKGVDLRYHHPDSLFNNCLHIENLAEFLEELCSRGFADNGIINLASAEPLTTEQVLRIGKNQLKSSSKMIIDKSNLPNFLISTEAAEEKYQFSPWPTSMAIRRYFSSWNVEKNSFNA
ncbi:NAD(P)-dependent oxidoreductase [Litorivicinus sp.]|nr:NAD(P)-dependent oxidoreductase [Litorivicinus sp.]